MVAAIVVAEDIEGIAVAAEIVGMPGSDLGRILMVVAAADNRAVVVAASLVVTVVVLDKMMGLDT